MHFIATLASISYTTTKLCAMSLVLLSHRVEHFGRHFDSTDHKCFNVAPNYLKNPL